MKAIALPFIALLAPIRAIHVRVGARNFAWVLLCALGTGLAGCALLPPGQPAAELSLGGVVISLYQEPCQLAAVENLPYRATWREASGNFQGCFDVQHGSVVVLYFEDRTVVTLPLAQFGPPAAPAEAPSTGSGQARPIAF